MPEPQDKHSKEVFFQVQKLSMLHRIPEINEDENMRALRYKVLRNMMNKSVSASQIVNSRSVQVLTEVKDGKNHYISVHSLDISQSMSLGNSVSQMKYHPGIRFLRTKRQG